MELYAGTLPVAVGVGCCEKSCDVAGGVNCPSWPARERTRTQTSFLGFSSELFFGIITCNNGMFETGNIQIVACRFIINRFLWIPIRNSVSTICLGPKTFSTTVGKMISTATSAMTFKSTCFLCIYVSSSRSRQEFPVFQPLQ